MAPTASKPKATIYSRNHNKYTFLCAATVADLNIVRKGLGLRINSKFRNGNVHLQCTQQHHHCNYLAMFVPKEKAIYAMSGRAHNHPVNGPPAKAVEDEPENAPPQQDQHQEEHNDEDDNQSIDEDEEEEEAMEGEDGDEADEGPPIKQEEADEEPLVVEEKHELANVRDAKHLDQLCAAMALEETGRTFKCKHANCPFRVSFASDESKLFGHNKHNH